MFQFILILVLSVCSTLVGNELKAVNAISELGWKIVQKSGRENSVNSPLSIWLALAMTHSGAKGKTASEISNILGTLDNRDEIAREAQSIKSFLDEASQGHVALSLANRIFPQTGSALLKSFINILETKYASSPEPLDFSKDTEGSRQKINRWISEKTDGQIAELIKPGVIDSLTRMVLTNAIYFKAPWAEAFSEKLTKPGQFFMTAKDSVSVPFMSRRGEYLAGEFRVGEAEGALCEIPYSEQRFSLLLIIPKKIDGANTVMKDFLATTPLRKILEGTNLRTQAVELSLPKWSFRKSIDLDGFLKELGMTSAFKQDSADFSGMDGKKVLYISKVVHEGFVEVAEEGTKASAATGVVMTLRGLPPASKPALKVRADRPFFWAIVEKASGLPVFTGRVENPSK